MSGHQFSQVKEGPGPRLLRVSFLVLKRQGGSFEKQGDKTPAPLLAETLELSHFASCKSDIGP